MFDLGFPIQIAHDFYLTIFKNFPVTPTIAKKFLLVSLLPNRHFFSLFYKWESVKLSKVEQDRARYEKLLNMTLTRQDSKDTSQYDTRELVSNSKWKSTKLFLRKLVSPESLRIAEFQWPVSTSKEFITQSVQDHVLFKYLKNNLIDTVYDDVDEETRLLLAIYCLNFDLTLTHTTSYRIQKMFSLLELKVEKGCTMEDKWKPGDEADGSGIKHIWDKIVKDFVEI